VAIRHGNGIGNEHPKCKWQQSVVVFTQKSYWELNLIVCHTHTQNCKMIIKTAHFNIFYCKLKQ